MNRPDRTVQAEATFLDMLQLTIKDSDPKLSELLGDIANMLTLSSQVTTMFREALEKIAASGDGDVTPNYWQLTNIAKIALNNELRS